VIDYMLKHNVLMRAVALYEEAAELAPGTASEALARTRQAMCCARLSNYNNATEQFMGAQTYLQRQSDYTEKAWAVILDIMKRYPDLDEAREADRLSRLQLAWPKAWQEKEE